MLECTSDKPELQNQITRALTGDLGSWHTLISNGHGRVTAPVTEPKLRPPPWSRLRPADVERMQAALARSRADQDRG